MSSMSGQSMNYLSPPSMSGQSMNHLSPPSYSTGSLRSLNSNCSLSYSSSGEVHINAAYDYADSSGVSSSHDYEDLQSVRTEAQNISGPRKKANDLYEPTRPHRVRQITECSDISMASSASSEALPVKKETCLSKLILCLILAVSVAALVLVVLIISGKLGPKCGCSQAENNLPSPSTGSTGRSFSVQSLLERIQDLERNMLAMQTKMEARHLAVEKFATKHENQVEILQAQVSAQKRMINETANKVSVVDGVWVIMNTGLKLLNKSVHALNKSDGEFTSTVNELRRNQILTKRMSVNLAVNVTQLESGVQELKKSSSNISSRVGNLEHGYAQMNSLMKSLKAVNGAQNTSHEDLQSLYKRLKDSLVTVNTTLHDKLKSLVSNGGKTGADFRTCQHRTITGTRGSVTPGSGGRGAFSDASYTEPWDKRATGIACSTDYARDYKLLSPRKGYYECACKGVSPTVTIAQSSIQCFLHVWECAISSS